MKIQHSSGRTTSFSMLSNQPDVDLVLFKTNNNAGAGVQVLGVCVLNVAVTNKVHSVASVPLDRGTTTLCECVGMQQVQTETLDATVFWLPPKYSPWKELCKRSL